MEEAGHRGKVRMMVASPTVKNSATPAAKNPGSRHPRAPGPRPRGKAEVGRSTTGRLNSVGRKVEASRRGKDPTPPDITTVPAYIAALTRWQRNIAEAFDEIVARQVPDVRRAIKWGLPFYGVTGRGWFVSLGGFRTGVKITFFQGASLKPLPPTGKG